MKHLFAIWLICLCTLSLGAQTTSKIRRLEKERSELHRQISESETLLQSTQMGVKSQLDNLALLSDQIGERKKYLQTIARDVTSIDQEIRRIQVELKGMNENLQARQDRYAHSVRYMSSRLSIQEKLMFVFAADDLNQMYRRMRYIQEYAGFQRLQGTQILEKQKEVMQKKKTLELTRKAKQDLLDQAVKEKSALEAKEKEKKVLLADLQKKQRGIQSELKKKKRSADALNAEIDRLIAYEVEQARLRAEAEQKRLAAEKARAREREAKNRQKLIAQKNAQQSSAANKGKVLKSAPKQQEEFRIDSDDRKLTGSFEHNKGRLPVPVTGPYAIIGHYGQYQVSGLRHVRLDNKGIDVKARRGAMARTVFDGEVSAIFQFNGFNHVLVRHGRYITVYCNLSSVLVRKGSMLKTRDVIGEIGTDADGNTVLHFQLRKETAKLNPEAWIKR